MKLEIKNINVVKNVSVKLNGLTVIAGENGSGKSTVGKILFSMVKALSNVGLQNQGYRKKTIQKYVDSLYKRLSGIANRYENDLFDKAFPLPSRKLVDHFMSIYNDELLDVPSKAAQYHILLDNMRSAVDSIKDITPRMRKLIEGDLTHINTCLVYSDSRAADMEVEIKYMIESEFMNKICSSKTTESSVRLEMDDENSYVHLTLSDDDVEEVNFKNYPLDLLQDATYIESPLYIHVLDSLLAASTYRERSTDKSRPLFGMVPIHIKDFAEKIDAVRYVSDDEAFPLMIEDGGCFKFKDKNLYYEKDGVKHSPINVASGLKSFGVIQMLLETKAISEEKILIWDEPENHLHPKWQIAFASALVDLVKQGIPIVVSTHSPYFVQGIRYYSAKEGVENFVNYYLAEQDEKSGLSEINEVTHDLNRVFSKLATPLNDIMNVDAARKQ